MWAREGLAPLTCDIYRWGVVTAVPAYHEAGTPRLIWQVIQWMLSASLIEVPSASSEVEAANHWALGIACLPWTGGVGSWEG